MLEPRPRRTVLPSLLIGIGWVLLALNTLEMLDFNSQHTGKITLRFAETQFSPVIRLTVLTMGTLSLGLVAWLHCKQGYARTTFAAAVIVAVLAVSLMVPATPLPSVAAEIIDSNFPVNDPYVRELAREGMITGIVFSSDRPSVVIGAEVLYEGDAKRGVTVVKIFKDRVELEKNGIMWTQTVRQRPPDYWR